MEAEKIESGVRRLFKKCYTFLMCLHVAISSSSHWNIVLKPKQVIALEKIFLGRDVLGVLPTGYGKSLIFHLLPVLLFCKSLNKQGLEFNEKRFRKIPTIVIVISPLNSLILDQIRRLVNYSFGGDTETDTIIRLTASVLNVNFDQENIMCDVNTADCRKDRLENGEYNMLFCHPEAFVSCKYGRDLMLGKVYQENVCAVIVDEAHCILQWGSDFRKDYGRLSMVCALFPHIPLLVLTATANKEDQDKIKETLGMSNCVDVIASPDRPNIVYVKYFRKGDSSIEDILKPIAQELLEKQVDYPITIIYLPLKWCGFAYVLFSYILGNKQYFPDNTDKIPKNRLFAQFHAPQTEEMKKEILKQLTSPNSIVRVVFATVAMGMGVDIPSIRQVIHIGPPRTVQQYYQETGRAGRDGKPSNAILYYNNRDIAKNKAGMQDMMRYYCQMSGSCLRKQLLQCMDASDPKSIVPYHNCCSECLPNCTCSLCKQKQD